MSQNKPLYSLSAERSVIGSLLLDPETWDKVSQIVTEADFYRHEHRAIFAAISDLCDRSTPFDVVTVGESLDRDGLLDEIGGVDYLIEVCEITPSVSSAVHYAEIVREHSVLRSLDQIGLKLRQQANERDGATAAEMIEESERLIMELGNSQQKEGGFRDSGDILNTTVEKIDALFNSDGKMSGVSTGLTDLDEMTNGLQKKDLIIVGARPSAGKQVY